MPTLPTAKTAVRTKSASTLRPSVQTMLGLEPAPVTLTDQLWAAAGRPSGANKVAVAQEKVAVAPSGPAEDPTATQAGQIDAQQRGEPHQGAMVLPNISNALYGIRIKLASLDPGLCRLDLQDGFRLYGRKHELEKDAMLGQAFGPRLQKPQKKRVPANMAQSGAPGFGALTAMMHPKPQVPAAGQGISNQPMAPAKAPTVAGLGGGPGTNPVERYGLSDDISNVGPNISNSPTMSKMAEPMPGALLGAGLGAAGGAAYGYFTGDKKKPLLSRLLAPTLVGGGLGMGIGGVLGAQSAVDRLKRDDTRQMLRSDELGSQVRATDQRVGQKIDEMDERHSRRHEDTRRLVTDRISDLITGQMRYFDSRDRERFEVQDRLNALEKRNAASVGDVMRKMAAALDREYAKLDQWQMKTKKYDEKKVKRLRSVTQALAARDAAAGKTVVPLEKSALSPRTQLLLGDSLIGGGLGAAAGAAAGAFNPGVDAKGRPRSRLRSALLTALAGGTLGAGAGAWSGYARGRDVGNVQDALNREAATHRWNVNSLKNAMKQQAATSRAALDAANETIQRTESQWHERWKARDVWDQEHGRRPKMDMEGVPDPDWVSLGGQSKVASVGDVMLKAAVDPAHQAPAGHPWGRGFSVGSPAIYGAPTDTWGVAPASEEMAPDKRGIGDIFSGRAFPLTNIFRDGSNGWLTPRNLFLSSPLVRKLGPNLPQPHGPVLVPGRTLPSGAKLPAIPTYETAPAPVGSVTKKADVSVGDVLLKSALHYRHQMMLNDALMGGGLGAAAGAAAGALNPGEDAQGQPRNRLRRALVTALAGGAVGAGAGAWAGHARGRDVGIMETALKREAEAHNDTRQWWNKVWRDFDEENKKRLLDGQPPPKWVSTGGQSKVAASRTLSSLGLERWRDTINKKDKEDEKPKPPQSELPPVTPTPTAILNKVANYDYTQAFSPGEQAALLIGGPTIYGATTAEDTGDPLRDILRGGTKGLGTGIGAAASNYIASKTTSDPSMRALAPLSGGATGYLLATRLWDRLHNPKRKRR